MDPLVGTFTELSVKDLISLSSTILTNPARDDYWNNKLAAAGYPRVDCAQGLWFLTQSGLSYYQMFVAAGNAGMVSHMKALAKVHHCQGRSMYYVCYIDAFCELACHNYPCINFFYDFIRREFPLLKPKDGDRGRSRSAHPITRST